MTTSDKCYRSRTRHEYSANEAKAKFSEVLRRVRRGQRIIVTYLGEPVAEIRPVQAGTDGLEARLAARRQSGAVIPATGDFSTFRAVAKRPGALRRFLADRG